MIVYSSPTRAFPVSARSSKTMFTARSRSSAGCGFLDTMSPNLPRGHSLQRTRGSAGAGFGYVGRTAEGTPGSGKVRVRVSVVDLARLRPLRVARHGQRERFDHL